MAKRCGITTDLPRRKQEHENAYKNVRDWKQYGPFANRKAAQQWEDNHGSDWEKHGGGNDPDVPNKWHGYEFTHDGKK